MGRKKQRVGYTLDTGDVKHLSQEEIKAILRGADECIAVAGRSMLVKILKGSKDKKVLEHKLDQCPVYGYYSNLKLSEISNRIDWMIKKGFLEIEYSGKLPVIVYSQTGWEIERETYAEELLEKLTKLREGEYYSFVKELKDRNRSMILLLIEKIRLTGNPGFIPLLEAWKEIEYKKVRSEIQKAIDYLVALR